MSTEAQPTPPAPPTPTPPAAPAQTPDQIAAESIRKATSFLAGKIVDSGPIRPKEDKPKEGEPPEPPPATPPAEPKAKEGEATPPEPKPKQVRKPAAKPADEAPALSPEQIAHIAATAAVEVTKRKEEPAATPTDENLELADEFASDRQYYEWMQRENPKKYGKLLKNLSDWGPKELDYIEGWEKDNPGRKYDPDSDEHDEFYAQNQPKIDANDLKQAKVKVAEVQESLKEEKLRRKIMDDMAPELAEIRMQKVARAAAPKLQAAAQGTIENILGGMNEEYAKHAKDKAKLDEIAEADPIAADVGQAMAGKWVPLATEVVAFHQGVPFNKDNPAHVDMYYRTLKLENVVGGLPPDQQVHEGRRFTTQEQYSRMSPEQRSRHWVIGEAELLYDIEREARLETEAIYKTKSEEFARYSKRKTAAPATNGKHVEQPPAPVQTHRNSSPSVVPSPAVTPGGSGAPITPKTGVDRFHERLLGNR